MLDDIAEKPVGKGKENVKRPGNDIIISQQSVRKPIKVVLLHPPAPHLTKITPLETKIALRTQCHSLVRVKRERAKKPGNNVRIPRNWTDKEVSFLVNMWFHPALAVQKEINNIKYSDIKCIVLEYIYI